MSLLFRLCVSAIAAATLADVSSAASLTTCDEGDALCVDQPFDTLTSIENLRKCVRIEDDQPQKLSQIRKISYTFDPPGGEALPNREVILDRLTILKSNAFGANRVIQAIEAQRGGTCEKDTKIWSVSASLAGLNRIAVAYATRVDIRDCGSFFGIDYINDVGSAGAEVHLVYRITDDFSLQQESLTVTNQWTESNWTYDLLGYVLPAMGPVGFVIANSIKQEINSASLGGSSTLTATFSNEFQALASGITSAENFARDVDLLHAPFWEFQRLPNQSGVVELGGNEATLQLVERASITPTWYGPRVLGFKQAEIKAIRELRLPRPRVHTVERGENLWTIASKYYAEPKMFALIESASNLRGSKIRPNQQLIVPFYTELCEQNNQGRIVKPGDSVWSLKRIHAGYNPSPREFRSKQLRLIYPFETVHIP